MRHVEEELALCQTALHRVYLLALRLRVLLPYKVLYVKHYRKAGEDYKQKNYSVPYKYVFHLIRISYS